MDGSITCPFCGGTGRATTPDMGMICETTSVTGFRHATECRACYGHGRVSQQPNTCTTCLGTGLTLGGSNQSVVAPSSSLDKPTICPDCRGLRYRMPSEVRYT